MQTSHVKNSVSIYTVVPITPVTPTTTSAVTPAPSAPPAETPTTSAVTPAPSAPPAETPTTSAVTSAPSAPPALIDKELEESMNAVLKDAMDTIIKADDLENKAEDICSTYKTFLEIAIKCTQSALDASVAYKKLGEHENAKNMKIAIDYENQAQFHFAMAKRYAEKINAYYTTVRHMALYGRSCYWAYKAHNLLPEMPMSTTSDITPTETFVSPASIDKELEEAMDAVLKESIETTTKAQEMKNKADNVCDTYSTFRDIALDYSRAALEAHKAHKAHLDLCRYDKTKIVKDYTNESQFYLTVARRYSKNIEDYNTLITDITYFHVRYTWERKQELARAQGLIPEQKVVSCVCCCS